MDGIRRSINDTSLADSRTDRLLKCIGWLAATAALLLYISFIDQIRLNLSGQKGSIILPAAAIVNSSLWTVYGMLKRDLPVIVGNLPGIILGAISLVTAL